MPNRHPPNDTEKARRPGGKVTSCIGAVTVNRAGHVPLWLPSGAAVFPGDTIETESDGMAVLELADGGALVLGPGSRAFFDHAVFDLDVGFGRVMMTLASGLFLYTSGSVARDDPNAVTIGVGVARVDVHDARIAGRVVADGGDTLVTLLPEDAGHVGAATVMTEAGDVALGTANETTVIADSSTAPTPGAVLQPLDLFDLYGVMYGDRWREDDGNEPGVPGGGAGMTGAGSRRFGVV